MGANETAAIRGRSLWAPSRRKFLTGALAFSAFPFLAKADGLTDCDVVIIGAGAAGIAAGEALHAAGKSVLLLEATKRTGGRAQTDMMIFGVPFDMGAHWLLYGPCNFFKMYAERYRHDFRIYESPEKYTVFIDGRPAKHQVVDEFVAAHKIAADSIVQMAESRIDDGPAAAAVDAVRGQLGAWDSSVRFAIGPWEMGKELEDFSALDWSMSEGRKDCEDKGKLWLCRQGYGSLVSHYAQSVSRKLPPGSLRLSTRVSAIRLNGTGVVVDTSRGSISARACVVTVSTGVLANEAIRFEPRLPDDKRRAFELISMGLYNRIGISFSRDVLGIGSDRYLFRRIENQDSNGHSIGFTTNVGGENIIYCDVGGQTAHELEQGGQQAAVDFALAELSGLFGSSVKTYFLRGHATTWGRNPYTCGSYASAVPGAYCYRNVLREPFEDRVFFAGEACDFLQWGTVAGANTSGRDVATGQVLPKLMGKAPQPQFGSPPLTSFKLGERANLALRKRSVMESCLQIVQKPGKYTDCSCKLRCGHDREPLERPKI